MVCRDEVACMYGKEEGGWVGGWVGEVSVYLYLYLYLPFHPPTHPPTHPKRTARVGEVRSEKEIRFEEAVARVFLLELGLEEVGGWVNELGLEKWVGG